ncbi:hypothetical protein ACUNWD_13520 [Sunxiuqinia sp. A32]|uniref:hypothetical protein n=1 Tax=Sunxiuqinia sp. A32 TaxID=3461496 RepID=UPI0040465BF8
MKKNKNISKAIIFRLVIVFLLFAGAMTFDLCHDQLPDQQNSAQENHSSHNLDATQVFFFNPASSFKLLDHGDKLLTRILYSANQDKFLAMFHNHRIFHSLKEDSLKDFTPFHLMAHFIKFTEIHYSSPDDYPPFC